MTRYTQHIHDNLPPHAFTECWRANATNQCTYSCTARRTNSFPNQRQLGKKAS